MKKKLTLLCLISSFFLLASQDEYQLLIDKAKFHEANNPDSVLHYAFLAFELDPDRIESAYWIGAGLRYKNEIDSALYWYNLYSERAQSDVQIGNAYMGMGGIYYAKKSYPDALMMFSKAATMFTKSEAMDRLGASYVNIGILNGLIGDESKAIAYYRESISIFEKLNNHPKALPAYVNLAEIYQLQENYDSSLFYAQKCYNIGDSLNLSFAKARALFVLAPSHIRSGKPDRGYNESIEGRRLFEEMGIENSMLSMLNYEAEALFELSRFEEALSICKNLESSEYSFKEQLYELMSKIYERQNQFQKALEYSKKYHMAYQEYEKELKSEQISRLEKQYETQRKANEILRLQNEVNEQELKTLKRNWIIVFISMFFFMAVAGIWSVTQRRLVREKEKSAIHKQQLLRSQINPHFIFNSLSSIRGFLFDSQDTKPAITYLGKFAKLMRMVLELSSKEWVSLEEEMNTLQLYLEIQQIRFNKSFDYELKLDSSIPASEIMVPPLTAQPFIENAIEHGLKGIESKGRIEVSCLKNDDRLVFKIQDNGIGIDKVKPRDNHESRATQIFMERLAIIGKRMKTNFSFNISDLSSKSNLNGTLVIYELPLLKHV